VAGVVASNASSIGENSQKNGDFGVCGAQRATKATSILQSAKNSLSQVDSGTPRMSVGLSCGTKPEKANLIFVFSRQNALISPNSKNIVLYISGDH
jgi:hypothetical protein